MTPVTEVQREAAWSDSGTNAAWNHAARLPQYDTV
jgi:hypothetical protein